MINIFISRDIKKNKVLLQEVKDNLSKGKTSYYFVPDQYTLFSDINLLDALETDVLMNVKVKSFSSFSNEILSRHGGLKKKVLTENGKNMLIKKILIDLSDQFSIFNRNINSKGFVSELANSISELKDQGISYKDFSEGLSKVESTNIGKLEDLSLVYEKYQNLIKDKYIDSNDKLKLLNEKLDYADELKEIEFFFDKYNSLNQQELDIITTLHGKGCIINFFLILDPRLAKAKDPRELDTVKDGELFESTFALYNKLREIDKDANIYPSFDQTITEMDYLANHIFSYEIKPYKKEVNNIKTIQCERTEDEIKFVCETIKKYVIEDGYKYKDFTIITSNSEEYNKFINRIFLQEEIPFFIDSKESLLDNKLAIFLVNILYLIVKKFRSEDVISFLKFFFKDINDSELEIFEQYIVSRKIKGQMFFQDKYFSIDNTYLESLRTKEAEILLNKLEITNKVRTYFISIISDYFTASKRFTSLNSHIENLFNFLYSDKVKAAISAFLDSQKEDEKLDSYNEQVWSYFIDTINELSDIQGDYEGSFDEFAQILIAGFENQNIGLIPPYQDVVFIGSTQRTRTNPSRVIFIVGLVENYFPSKVNFTSIIDDDERILLKENDIDLPIKEIQFKSEEYMNLYSNILKADEKLFVTTSLNNSSNDNLTPSIYFNQIYNIFPKLEGFRPNEFFKEIKFSKSILIKNLIVNLEESLSREDLNEDKVKLLSYLYEKNNNQIFSAIASLRNDTTNLEKAEGLYDTNSLSVTRIQTFARCPYKHFIRYGLRPSEKIEYDIESREIGNIAHNSLASFIKDYFANKDYYRNMDDEEFKDLLYSKLIEHASEEIDDNRINNEKNQVILNIAINSLYTGIWNVKRQLDMSSFDNVETEASFSKDGDIPPLIIDVNGRKIELEGFIDRVDSYNDKNLIVIDYKTGDKEFNLTFAKNGIDIQLPIYLRATSQSNPKYKEAGFFYLPIRDIYVNTESTDEDEVLQAIYEKLFMDGAIIKNEEVIKALDPEFQDNPTVIRFRSKSSNVLEEKDLNQLIDDVIQVTKNNVDGIYSGNIKTIPYIHKGTSECYYCDYKNICKFDLKRNKTYRILEEAKWSDYKSEK